MNLCPHEWECPLQKCCKCSHREIFWRSILCIQKNHVITVVRYIWRNWKKNWIIQIVATSLLHSIIFCWEISNEFCPIGLGRPHPANIYIPIFSSLFQLVRILHWFWDIYIRLIYMQWTIKLFIYQLKTQSSLC